MKNTNSQKNSTTILLNERDSGLLFSCSALFPLILSYLFYIIVMLSAKDYQTKPWFIYCAYACGQLALVIAIYLFATKIKRANVLNLVGFNGFKYIFIAIIPLISFGCIFGLGFLNDYFIQFLTKLGFNPSTVAPPLNTPLQLIISLLIVAVLPAVVEETMFRGLILKGMSGESVIKIVLLNGFMFSLYHHNPAQTIYQFLNGCIFAYIAIKSMSVLPTVILHFLNNAFVLVFSFIAPTYVFTGLTKYLLIGFGLLSLGIGLLLTMFLTSKKQEKTYSMSLKYYFIYSSVGIALLALLWGVSLI